MTPFGGELPGRASSVACEARHALKVWVCILFQTTALSGCALCKTYEKCGFRGCPGDAIITADVVLQLNRCSYMEPNAVNVQTIDHVVYLNGVVRSSLEIGTAESIADQVPGVTRVVNSIVAFTRCLDQDDDSNCLLLLRQAHGYHVRRPSSRLGLPLLGLPTQNGQRVRCAGAISRRLGGYCRSIENVRSGRRWRKPEHVPLLPHMRCHGVLHQRGSRRQHHHSRRCVRGPNFPRTHVLCVR